MSVNHRVAVASLGLLLSSLALLGGAATLAACSGEAPPNPEPDAAPSTVPTPTTTPTTPTTPTASTPPDQTPDATSPADAGHDGDSGATTFCEFRTTKCGRTAASCKQEEACLASLRPGAGAAIKACVLASMSCNQVDDCLELEALKYESVAAPKAFETACLSKLSSCGSVGGLDDNTCVNLLVFPDTTLATLQACLAKPCTDIGVCLAAELTKVGCN